MIRVLDETEFGSSLKPVFTRVSADRFLGYWQFISSASEIGDDQTSYFSKACAWQTH
jgi:hypothetical protein